MTSIDTTRSLLQTLAATLDENDPCAMEWWSSVYDAAMDGDISDDEIRTLIDECAK